MGPSDFYLFLPFKKHLAGTDLQHADVKWAIAFLLDFWHGLLLFEDTSLVATVEQMIKCEQ
jgi:hypothetical protein